MLIYYIKQAVFSFVLPMKWSLQYNTNRPPTGRTFMQVKLLDVSELLLLDTRTQEST